MCRRWGWALFGLAGCVLSGCALDVQGTASLDAGDLGGEDAGMSVTIPDAGTPPPIEASADMPDVQASVDASGPDHAEGMGCPSGAAVLDIDAPLPNNTSNFGTTGPACARYFGDVMGWGVSNGQGRTVTVVGATTVGPVDAVAAMTEPMAAGADGYVYWILTAGTVDYVSVYAY